MSTDRRNFLGGSDIAAVIGESPWKDPFALYLEKRGEIEPPTEETRAQRRGKILEPAIAELYAAEYGAQVCAGGTVQIADAPHFRAQIDAYEHDGNVDVPVEIKSASEFTRGKWGPSGTDDAPTYYCAQLHWQLLATGAPYGRIVALLGADDLRVYTIERDAAVAKFLLNAALAFWTCVQEGRAPPVNFEHPSTGDTLGRLFSNPNATEIVQANDILRSYRDVYVDAGDRIKHYEAIREGARLHMLAAMRNAAILDFGDGQIVERKTITRKAYAVEESRYIDFRLKKSRTEKRDPARLERFA